MMSQLPPSIWLALAGTVLLLVALCAFTVRGVLRATTRSRIAHWPAWRVAAVVAVAALPWIIVVVRVHNFSVNVNGVWQAIGWLLVVLLIFAVLVLLPLAALLGAAVWTGEWYRRRRFLG